MKLTAIILLSASLVASAKGNTQSVTLSLKNAPLEKAFKEIKKQTGYSFIYTETFLKEARPVSIDVKNSNIEEVLQLCFANQPFSYEVVEKTIVLKPKEKSPNDHSAVILSGVEGQAPPIDVRGRIVNESGEPVLATIQVKGMNKGTITNSDGYFELRNVDDNATLVISASNIETREIKLNGKNDLDVVNVKMKNSPLDEIQVEAYRTNTRRLSTSNITTIKSTEIETQPIQNPLLALQGRVPGLLVTQNSGLPGASVTIRLQGQNSINAANGNDPLIVIDGVPFPTQTLLTTAGGFNGGLLTNLVGPGGGGNPLNYLNPNEIESIDVLKGADATAIYGSRAANGAILITTKKGKAGKLRTEINLQQGIAKIARKLDLLNTQQYLAMRKEAFNNDNISIPMISSTPDNSDYDVNGLWDTTRYTDWQKVLIGGTAQITDANLDFSGGAANMQFLFGGSFHKETSIFPGHFNDKRGNAHFKLNSSSVNGKFKTQIEASYIDDNNELPSVDFATQIYLAPNAPAIYNADGTLNWAPTPLGAASWSNPFAALTSKYQNKSTNLITSTNYSYDIIPGLTLRANLGYTVLQIDELGTNPASSVDPSTRSSFTRTGQFTNSKMATWIVEPQLNYIKNIGNSKLNFLIGSSLQNTNNQGQFIFASGFPSDQVIEDIGSATSISGSTVVSKYKYEAAFARINYTLRGRYIMNITSRRDGSTRFGPASRFHNFGAIGAAWLFSEEKFVEKNLSFLSYGKIRGSYGITGNDQIPDYSFMSLIPSYNVGVPYQNSGSISISRLTNPYLHWEETRKLEVGIDLGFLQDKVLISANYSLNHSDNQLLQYRLPSFVGFSTVTNNFPATVENRSFEFDLSTSNIKTSNFTWTSRFNLTVPKNKLTSFPNLSSSSYSSVLVIGQPLNVVKNFRGAGVDPNTGLYQFINSQGAITSTPIWGVDNTLFVSELPKFYGGFQNDFQYRHFQFGFLLQYTNQRTASNYFILRGNPGVFFGGTNNQPISVLDRWQKTGEIATIQKFSTSSALSTSEAYFSNSYDASFFRLKNCFASWEIPSVWRAKLRLTECNLFIHCQNAFTRTKYKGLDPESIGAIPPLRTMTIGAKIGF